MIDPRIINVWRCDVTGNPCGTDARRIGSDCECQACRMVDKIEGLEADLASAVEVAFKRGATDWARLNYPKMHSTLAGSPATQNARFVTSSTDP